MKTYDMSMIGAMHQRSTLIKPEVQTHWGGLVAGYIFLAGLGAGTFLISFLMLSMGKFSDPARIGVFAGPVLVSIGAFLLLVDLGSPSRFFRLFTTPATWRRSWLVRGSYILGFFILLALAYAMLPWLPLAQPPAWVPALGIAAAIFALLVLVEPGLLLAVNNSIPLWNTSALPALFAFSGLSTGLAVLMLISAASSWPIGVDGFHLLANTNSAVLVLFVIVLASYLEIVRQAGQTAATSVQLLLSPRFIWGGIVAGILLPLVMLVWSATVSDPATLRVLGAAASILILIGGLLLRLGVVKSGLRLPVIA